MPTFRQVFYEDNAISSTMRNLRDATAQWAGSPIFTEAILLNCVSDAICAVSGDNCGSAIYPEINVNAVRTILDRKGPGNTDFFGSDLGITLSMEENGVLIKQRTVLFQLKLGTRTGTDTHYKLDLRQIYLSGHNQHSAGRWFMAVCDKSQCLWKFASERQIGSALTELHTGKVAYPHREDRIEKLLVGDEWSSLSEWMLDWLSESIGRDSDLSDPNRLETIIEQVRLSAALRKADQDLDDEFEQQFVQYRDILPRVHIEVHIKEKKPAKA